MRPMLLNISGFSLIEMIVTITIMVIFGSVGIMQVSHLKNYFSVQSAQEKLQSAIQNTKKDILDGQASCGSVQVYSQDFSKEKDRSLFFVNEEWTPADGKCVSGIVKDLFVTVVNDKPQLNITFDFKLQGLKCSTIALQAVDQNLQALSIVDDTGNTLTNVVKPSEPISMILPLNSINSTERYHITASQKGKIFSNIEIIFYNANAESIANKDPSIIRVEKIQAKDMSQQDKQGNLAIMFEAPYAKSQISLFDENDQFIAQVKDVHISFINQNNATGEYEIFNASLLHTPFSQQASASERTSCFFEQDGIKLTCK